MLVYGRFPLIMELGKEEEREEETGKNAEGEGEEGEYEQDYRQEGPIENEYAPDEPNITKLNEYLLRGTYFSRDIGQIWTQSYF